MTPDALLATIHAARQAYLDGVDCAAELRGLRLRLLRQRNRVVWLRSRRLPRSHYLAREAEKMHHLLPEIIALYQAGVSQRGIAERLAIPYGTARSLIGHARKTGRWPEQLIRGSGKRTDLI